MTSVMSALTPSPLRVAIIGAGQVADLVNNITLVTIGTQLVEQSGKIKRAASRLITMVIGNMHMAQQVAVLVQRFSQRVFFNIG